VDEAALRQRGSGNLTGRRRKDTAAALPCSGSGGP